MAARLLGEAAQVLCTHRFRGSHCVQELTATAARRRLQRCAPLALAKPLSTTTGGEKTSVLKTLECGCLAHSLARRLPAPAVKAVRCSDDYP